MRPPFRASVFSLACLLVRRRCAPKAGSFRARVARSCDRWTSASHRADPRLPSEHRAHAERRARRARPIACSGTKSKSVSSIAAATVGEADYLFPLPANAAFQDLKLSINGELVSGETMNAGEARRIYENIVRPQRDPALVEWMGHGLLRARIFPINPGEEKRIVVRFQSVAPREGDALRVDYFRGAARGARRPCATAARRRSR